MMRVKTPRDTSPHHIAYEARPPDMTSDGLVFRPAFVVPQGYGVYPTIQTALGLILILGTIGATIAFVWAVVILTGGAT